VYHTYDLTDLIKRRLTPDASLANVARLLHARADSESMECTSAETCASVDDAPFCYNEETGEFRDLDNTKGNILTGDYTLADGRTGNLYNGPHPVPSGSEDVATTTGAAAAATAAASASTRASGTGAASNTAAAAAATVGSTDSATAAAATAASTSKPATNGAGSGNLKSALGGLVVLLAGLL
jgi:hypothetical protein